MIINNLAEFYNLLKSNQPLLAIDYGKKKWGIALSNPTLTVSLPLETFSQQLLEVKITALKEIVNKYKVSGIIIGWPVNMNGTHSLQSLEVLEFANNISDSLALPIFLQDERLTTKAANNALKSMGMKRKKRNQLDDVVAASMILETVLQLIKNLKLSEFKL